MARLALSTFFSLFAVDLARGLEGRRTLDAAAAAADADAVAAVAAAAAADAWGSGEVPALVASWLAVCVHSGWEVSGWASWDCGVGCEL